MSVSAAPPTAVILVRTAGCHLCTDALAALAAIDHDFPLAVEVVEATDPRGQGLVREHRPPLFPLVLVDGVFFSFGRLPRKKLRKALALRAVAVT